MDPICVGNWSRNPQGVLWFIEVGEGITEVTEQRPEEACMTVNDPMNNQEELEDQSVEEHKKTGWTCSYCDYGYGIWLG